jgi:hypothetical protein
LSSVAEKIRQQLARSRRPAAHSGSEAPSTARGGNDPSATARACPPVADAADDSDAGPRADAAAVGGVLAVADAEGWQCHSAEASLVSEIVVFVKLLGFC